MPPSFFIWRNCSARSFMSNSPFFIFAASFSAFSLSSVSAAFSTRLTTSPMSRMRAATRAGWNDFQRVELFAEPQEFDRRAGDRAHGERRAAARIAVGARQDDAGERHALVEGLGDVDRVLAGQAVGDEQRLVRLDRVAHLRHLGHQLLRRCAGGRRCRGSARRSRRRGPRPSRAWRCRAASGRRRWAASRRPPARPARAAAPWRRDGGRRARPSARASFLWSAAAGRAWPRWWSCPSPAGRPSGSARAASRD